MNFLSNSYPSTMLMGMGVWALSECLRNQEKPIAQIAHVASFALCTGLVVYSTRQAYRLKLNLSTSYSLHGSEPYSCTPLA